MSPYGTIFYHIINGDGTFQIDSHSGELILSRPLDREKKEKHEVMAFLVLKLASK